MLLLRPKSITNSKNSDGCGACKGSMPQKTKKRPWFQYSLLTAIVMMFVAQVFEA